MSGSAMVAVEMLAVGLWMLFDPHDSRRFRLFGFVWLVCLCGLICRAVPHFEDLAFPIKLDGSLYALDKALGVTSFPLGRLLLHGWTGVLISEIYEALLPMIVVWGAMSLIVWRESGIIWGLLIEMVAAPCMYALVPACGPAYAFSNFPTEPLLAVPASMPLAADANAMPSIHVATALLLFLFARGKWWKGLSLIFLIGTSIATLASGEHYVMDLIVAVPFACFVDATVRKRFGAAVFSAMVVLAWLLAIRFGATWLATAPSVLGLATLLTLTLGALYCFFGRTTSALLLAPGWRKVYGDAQA